MRFLTPIVKCLSLSTPVQRAYWTHGTKRHQKSPGDIYRVTWYFSRALTRGGSWKAKQMSIDFTDSCFLSFNDRNPWEIGELKATHTQQTHSNLTIINKRIFNRHTDTTKKRRMKFVTIEFLSISNLLLRIRFQFKHQPKFALENS